MTSKIYTENEIGFKRVFEIRIRDLRERDGIKQKSFSLSVKKETKDKNYIKTIELKEKIEEFIKDNL